MDYIYRYDSPLGGITMAGCGAALSGLWFDGQQHFAATLSPGFVERDLPVFQETIFFPETITASMILSQQRSRKNSTIRLRSLESGTTEV